MRIFKIMLIVLTIILSSSIVLAGTFTENFNSGQAKDWESLVGDWKVENGAYVEKAGTLYAKTMFGNEKWTDYTVEVDVTLLKAVNLNCAGLLVRSDKKGDNAFRFWIRTDVPPQLAKWIGGNNAYVLLKENLLPPGKIAVGGTYHLKVVIKGNKYQYFIDKDMVTEYEDNENFRDSGRIGFITHSAYPVFDNLVISGSEIPSSPVEPKSKLTTLWGGLKSFNSIK